MAKITIEKNMFASLFSFEYLVATQLFQVMDGNGLLLIKIIKIMDLETIYRSSLIESVIASLV